MGCSVASAFCQTSRLDHEAHCANCEAIVDDEILAICALCNKYVCNNCSRKNQTIVSYYQSTHCRQCVEQIRLDSHASFLRQVAARAREKLDKTKILSECTKIEIGNMCFLSFPCEHHVVATMPDGWVVDTLGLLGARDIVKVLARLGQSYFHGHFEEQIDECIKKGMPTNGKYLK
jgi:hypothetical protein